jgi:O-antigen ligase
MLVAFGLGAFLSRNGSRPEFERTDFLVIALVIVAATFATAFSDYPARSGRYLVYLCLNIFLLALTASVKSERILKGVVASLALMGLVHLMTLLVSRALSGPSAPEELVARQPLVTLLVPNDALILGLCLPAVAFTMWQTRRRWPAPAIAVLLGYFFLAAYASYLLQSKTALVALLTALLASAAAWSGGVRADLKSGSKAQRGLLIFLAGLLLLASTWWMGNRSDTRLGLWSHALRQETVGEVLVGSGPNTFNYDPASIDDPVENGARIIPWAHNVYIEAYSEQGLAGLAGIIAMTLVPIVRSTRIENRRTRTLVFACAITFCLVGLIEITLTRRFCFAYLAIVYGLSCSPAVRVRS